MKRARAETVISMGGGAQITGGPMAQAVAGQKNVFRPFSTKGGYSKVKLGGRFIQFK